MSEELKVERILRMYDRLLNGKGVDLRKEANEAGVSERSIKRDISELRNHLENISIEGNIRKELIYDRKDKCYYLLENGQKKSKNREIYAVSKILMGSKGLAYTEMERILQHLLENCQEDKERKELRKLLLNEMYNYRGPNHGKEILDLIWEIAEAAEYERKVRIQYQRLEGRKKVERVLKPLGVLFSEYYFYMLALIDGVLLKYGKTNSPTIYRIDRINKLEVLDEHFQIPYSERFKEQEFRNQAPLMWGGELKYLKFWYSGPSLEAVLDKIPTAKVIDKVQENYLISAKVIGCGAEIWLKGQEGVKWMET